MSIPEGLRIHDPGAGGALVIEQRASLRRRRRAAGVLALLSVLLPLAWWAAWDTLVLALLVAVFTAAALQLAHPMASWALSRTLIRVEPGREIVVRYGPFAAFAEDRTLPEHVAALYVAGSDKPRRFVGKYQVRALLAIEGGRHWIVAQGLDTAEQAGSVAQAIARELGIAVATEVPAGELTLASSATLAWSLAPALGPMVAGALFFLVFQLQGDAGEPVGRLDLSSRDAAVAFDAEAGDRLELRSDVEMDGVHRRGLKLLLGDAVLEVRLRAPGGVERTARCALYENIAYGRSWGSADDRAGIGGMPNRCSLSLERAGRYELRASVRWPAGVGIEGPSPRLATLELRRVRDR